MKILFTDDQEYDNENSSENIEFLMKNSGGYDEVIHKSEGVEYRLKHYTSAVFPVIKVKNKNEVAISHKIKAIYPISQIKRIIP
jgi:hypothetical protein